ncbi:MAG: HEAT repeat domain-containing protein [Phycisphaerales bacterium]
MKRWPCLVLLAALGGCGLDLRPGAPTIMEALRGSLTPADMVILARDEYDANNRLIGTQALVAEPFASEPVYIQLFILNASDPDPSVRGAALRGLATHGEATHASILAAALRDQASPVGVRLEAARGLQRLHLPSAVDSLLNAVAAGDDALGSLDTQAEVRAEAALALGQYAEPRVVDALIAALDDSDLSVNRAAQSSLRTLTGQDLGIDRGSWVQWRESGQSLFAARAIYNYPVFNRSRRLLEYIPIFPKPPNEITSTPAGYPRS